MFVSSKQFKRNLKLFFYDKELPATGSNNESVVLPVLDCLDNPKAVTPHTNIFSMSKKNKFVTQEENCPCVTPAERQLLNLLKGPEVADYVNSLRLIHYNGTYGVGIDEFSPSDSRYTHRLLDALTYLADERKLKTTKTSL